MTNHEPLDIDHRQPPHIQLRLVAETVKTTIRTHYALAPKNLIIRHIPNIPTLDAYYLAHGLVWGWGRI